MQKVMGEKDPNRRKQKAMNFYMQLYQGGEYTNFVRMLATCVDPKYQDLVVDVLQKLELIGFMAVGKL